MVNMKKALKILEPRRTRERKDDTMAAARRTILDPSHELSMQQHRPATSHNEQSYSLHPAARHSNPELHTPKIKWSSAASVVSVERDAVSLYNDDVDEDLDILQYDLPTHSSPTRRRSTGSSRQKSQQKLAKILGWNTNFPQTKDGPRHSQSVENLSSPVSTAKSPSTYRSPLSWSTDVTDSYGSEAGSMFSRKRRTSSHRSNSIKSTTSARCNSAEPYDFQMRQFMPGRAYDKEKARSREAHDIDLSVRTSAARSESPSSPGPQRRGSNPNVHKPLPTTPSFPSFPAVHPLSQSTLTSNSTPVSEVHEDDDYYIPNISAEEAHVLLSQPEPIEMPTDTCTNRVELPSSNEKDDPSSRIRSRSPTQPRCNSASSAVNDFGPGTTLSIIEEEPWSTEDLAAFKVWELPAEHALPTIMETPPTATGSDASCPGLSPSSSLSSRKLRAADGELECGQETIASSSRVDPDPPAADADGEGEEITVLFEDRPRPHPRSADMREKSFLSLEDDSEDDNATDTEESVRNSYRFSRASSARGWPLPEDYDENSLRRNPHRASVETTKTAYTTSSEKTVVVADYSNDLAKRMDWV